MRRGLIDLRFCCTRCYDTGWAHDQNHRRCGHVGGLCQAKKEKKEKETKKTCYGEWINFVKLAKKQLVIDKN